MEKQYTLKVYPNGQGHSVYRVIEISGKNTLNDLCSEILSAYDFTDEHLYEFCMDNKKYSRYSYQGYPSDGGPSADIKLDKLHLVKGQKFLFHYDYGDDWMFTVNVQKITEVPESFKARVVKEKGYIEQYPEWDEDDYWEDDDFDE